MMCANIPKKTSHEFWIKFINQCNYKASEILQSQTLKYASQEQINFKTLHSSSVQFSQIHQMSFALNLFTLWVV